MIRFCAFFLLCCLFAPGAMPCVNITDKVQGICPFFNQTMEGYLPEIDRYRVIFHFGPLFRTRCSPLTKIFICSSLFPLCLPSGVLLPCRDVCFSVYTSCHHIFLLHDFEWPEYLDCNKLPARPRLCLSPTSPTPLFSVPSAFSVHTVYIFCSVCSGIFVSCSVCSVVFDSFCSVCSVSFVFFCSVCSVIFVSFWPVCFVCSVVFVSVCLLVLWFYCTGPTAVWYTWSFF